MIPISIKIPRNSRKKKNTILLIVFLFLLISFVFVMYFYFIRTPKEENVYFTRVYRTMRINFSVLENPILKELEPYIPPALSEEKLGRENPFINY